ncbi:MAG: two-component system response regulator AtoC [Verrucomicrobiales bacterium]|jgi:two-component system response regulator AtoC
MITESTVLIVDDEKNTRDGLRRWLEDDFDVYVAADAAEAKEVLKGTPVDVMVTDLRLGADDGMQLIEHALGLARAPICIMMTAYGSVDTAVEAMKRGAYDFVTKPLNMDALEILIKRALKTRGIEEENVSLKRQVEDKFVVSNIIGEAAAMRPVFDTIEQVAPTRATVMISGESGTGKELVAHALHNLSGRPKSKLVIVHCAALSPQLLESELFGHEKGAFTDAREKRIGRFEHADGGTLFLDEIGEIDAATQVKLLRAIGERTVERLGSNQPIKVDVRVIAATNRDLKKEVAEGRFREDLFYRLNVVRIHMPPLRDRKEDIPILANTFLQEFAKENRREVSEFTSEAMRSLIAHQWPGNVRELRTAIEHGVVMCNGPKITLRHLPESVREEGNGMEVSAGGSGARAGSAAGDLDLEASERRMIERALERTDGNRSKAAELLGISRRTLQRKLKAFQDGISD